MTVIVIELLLYTEMLETAIKGKAIVGTVSGTSISFGTAVDVDTGNPTDYLTAVFNPDVNKVLITYDASDKKGKSKIGTVSGTGISLTGVTIFNNDTNNDGTIYQSSCYDTTSNTHLIVYRDNTLSGASTNHVIRNNWYYEWRWICHQLRY